MSGMISHEVRSHYARLALTVLQRSACCGPSDGASPRFGPGLYSAAEIAALPAGAVAASLGCGNPTALADLRPGDTVLDLGSGGGIDVLLAAARIGPDGIAYGLDMVPEMLALARRNAQAAGLANARFLDGEMEAIPLPDATVDVVISNCVINLSPTKGAVFAEIARVLRPGGRLAVSDVVADDDLGVADRAARGSLAGCIAGALSFGEYAAGLAAAGLGEIEITPTHTVLDGMYGAIVRAVRPATANGDTVAAAARAVSAGVAATPATQAAAAALAAARALPANGLVPLGAPGADAVRGCAPGGGCCG
jgi:SAM-dependent methyltransferase